MGIEFSFIVWLIVVIIVFFLARNYNISWWSSLVLALFFGLIILGLALGWDLNNNDNDDEECSSSSSRGHGKNKKDFARPILGLLGLISVVIVTVYVVQKVFEDTCPNDDDNKSEM